MKRIESIKVLITAHNESYLLTNSVKSVFENINFAKESHTFICEVYLNLDFPDFETRSVALDLKLLYPDLNLSFSEFRDVSIVRNLFASKFNDAFLFFLDGDDYWSIDWIQRFLKIKNKSTSTIFHPRYTIFYDHNQINILKSRLLRCRSAALSQMMVENIFSSSFICHSNIFKKFQFKSGSIYTDNIYAYEDWSFFRDTMSHNIKHKLILGTTHFHFVRHSSNTTASLKSKKIPHPFDLL